MENLETNTARTVYARAGDALRCFFFALTLPLFSILLPTASYAACGVHNQLCIFHSLGAPVNLQIANTPANQIPTGNNLVIYAIGKDPVTGLPSTVDFDNKVLLPAKTGNKAVVGSPTNYTTSTTPIVVSATPYGAAHPPPMWDEVNNTGIGALQVYGSQYQVIFNNLTSTARITGDPGGGEESNIPNSTSCPNLPAGARNCEAVIVSGNVPSGFYEQKVRIFNFPGVANPKVDVQAGAYVTGQLELVSKTHENTQQAYFPKLEGTGAISPTYQYEVYNRGFNPHAAGVATFDLSKSRNSYGSREIGDHTTRYSTYRDTYTTHTMVWGDKNQGYLLGDGLTSSGSSKTYSHDRREIGYVDVTKIPQIPMLPDNSNKLLTGVGALLPNHVFTTLIAESSYSYIDLVNENLASQFAAMAGGITDFSEKIRDVSGKSRIGSNLKWYSETKAGFAYNGGLTVTTKAIKPLATTTANYVRPVGYMLDAAEVGEVYINEGGYGEKTNIAAGSKLGGYVFAAGGASLAAGTLCAFTLPVCVGGIVVIGGVAGIAGEAATKQALQNITDVSK